MQHQNFVTVVPALGFVRISSLILQLGKTSNDHLVQLLDHYKADQKLKRDVKDIVQMPVKH